MSRSIDTTSAVQQAVSRSSVLKSRVYNLFDRKILPLYSSELQRTNGRKGETFGPEARVITVVNMTLLTSVSVSEWIQLRAWDAGKPFLSR